jgi:exodeoxyribonuclease X
MTVRVIDCETTGTDAAVDAVIEIASVDVLADGTITNRQEALICPPIPVPPEASAVHHLLYQDLTGKPAFDDVVPMFAGAQAYVAHNAEFEQAFLGEHLGGDALWVCTRKCALRVWPDFPVHSNQALRYRLGFASPFGIDRATLNPHRALFDAIVTAAVFVELTKRAKWSDLVRWSAEPALYTRLTFGKAPGRAVRRRTGGLSAVGR